MSLLSLRMSQLSVSMTPLSRSMRDSYKYEDFNRRLEERRTYGNTLRINMDTIFNRAMQKAGKTATGVFMRPVFTRGGRRARDDTDRDYKTIHFRPASFQGGAFTYGPRDRPSEKFEKRWGK